MSIKAMAQANTVEGKFEIFYKERRRLYDQGKDIGSDKEIQKYFYQMADEFNRQDCLCYIEELRVCSHSSLPAHELNKIETAIMHRTANGKNSYKAPRWKLLMVMCDMFDEYKGSDPKPKIERSRIFDQHSDWFEQTDTTKASADWFVPKE
tara:strand:+ start:166 stop:618 length:453 start_codon:yes stop_codon:yes gene_type:complete